MAKIYDCEVDMRDWSVAERYIVARLDRLENKVDGNVEKMTALYSDVAGLRVKTGMFAAAFGILGSFLVAFIKGH